MRRPSSLALLLLFAFTPAGAQTFRADAEPVAAPGAFGNAIAVADGQVLVGEPENQLRPGIVYVYGNASGAWAETAQITAADAVDGDGFGSAIAVDGATMVVGATGQDDERGAVYVFARQAGGSWLEIARLVASDGAQDDGFGAAVALSGDWALVGAPGHGPAGAVYAFRRDPAGWTQQAKLVPTGVAPRAIFGAALALDGGRALIGAPGQNDRYPTADWNIYAAQASDGENWHDDSPIARDLLTNSILPLVQYFAYVEISEQAEQALWHAYEEVQAKNPESFAMKKVTDAAEIYPVFHELFKKKTQ